MSKYECNANDIERRAYDMKCLIGGMHMRISYHFYNCVHMVDLHCHLIMISVILGISDNRAVV